MELIYINEDGVSVVLRQTKPFFLTKLEGVGRIRGTVRTFQAPDQDGAFFVSSSLDMRDIAIEGSILAQDEAEAYEYRRQLLRVFTPKRHGTLVYRQKRIACVVEEAGFSVSTAVRAPSFFFNLLCPSPFFESLEELRVELASWQEKFQFPLEIVMPGIELGVRQPSQIITINNIGDTASGCEIVFKALGAVGNPELMNLDTNEYIRLNVTMTNGQEIHAFTHFAGKKVVSITGSTETNAFPLLDVGSTFLQINPGGNTFRYDASSNLDMLEVTVYYRPQFLAV
ncbi:MAG: phage tail family protein [Oscillospiraceae bacterium]|jgi:hypothetical protein|nr:phage tail family protein [Oscillospiraceae bacterium]